MLPAPFQALYNIVGALWIIAGISWTILYISYKLLKRKNRRRAAIADHPQLSAQERAIAMRTWLEHIQDFLIIVFILWGAVGALGEIVWLIRR